MISLENKQLILICEQLPSQKGKETKFQGNCNTRDDDICRTFSMCCLIKIKYISMSVYMCVNLKHPDVILIMFGCGTLSHLEVQ